MCFAELLTTSKSLTLKATSIEEIVTGLKSAADKFDQMRQDGVVIGDGGTEDNHPRLVTTDANVAEKYIGSSTSPNIGIKATTRNTATNGWTRNRVSRDRLE